MYEQNKLVTQLITVKLTNVNDIKYNRYHNNKIMGTIAMSDAHPLPR